MNNIQQAFKNKARNGLRLANGTGNLFGAPMRPASVDLPDNFMGRIPDAAAPAGLRGGIYGQGGGDRSAAAAPALTDAQHRNLDMMNLGRIDPTPGEGAGAAHHWLVKTRDEEAAERAANPAAVYRISDEVPPSALPAAPAPARRPPPGGLTPVNEMFPSRRPATGLRLANGTGSVSDAQMAEVSARMCKDFGVCDRKPEAAPPPAPAEPPPAPPPKPDNSGGLLGIARRALGGASRKIEAATNYARGGVVEGVETKAPSQGAAQAARASGGMSPEAARWQAQQAARSAAPAAPSRPPSPLREMGAAAQNLAGKGLRTGFRVGDAVASVVNPAAAGYRAGGDLYDVWQDDQLDPVEKAGLSLESLANAAGGVVYGALPWWGSTPLGMATDSYASFPENFRPVTNLLNRAGVPTGLGNYVAQRKPGLARGGIVRGKGGPTDDAVPMTLSGVPVNLSNAEAVLPVKTVKALGGPAAVEKLIERTNGKPPVKRGLRAGGKYGEGGLLTEEARRKAAASQQEETDATAWQAQVNAAVNSRTANDLPTDEGAYSTPYLSKNVMRANVEAKQTSDRLRASQATEPSVLSKGWGRLPDAANSAQLPLANGQATGFTVDASGGIIPNDSLPPTRRTDSPPVSRLAPAPATTAGLPAPAGFTQSTPEMRQAIADYNADRQLAQSVLADPAFRLPEGVKGLRDPQGARIIDFNSAENLANRRINPFLRKDGEGVASMRQKDGTYRNIMVGAPTTRWEDTAQYKAGVAQAEKDKARLREMQHERLERTAAMPGATAQDRQAYALSVLERAGQAKAQVERQKAEAELGLKREEVGLKREEVGLKRKEAEARIKKEAEAAKVKATEASTKAEQEQLTNLYKILKEESTGDKERDAHLIEYVRFNHPELAKASPAEVLKQLPSIKSRAALNYAGRKNHLGGTTLRDISGGRVRGVTKDDINLSGAFKSALDPEYAANEGRHVIGPMNAAIMKGMEWMPFFGEGQLYEDPYGNTYPLGLLKGALNGPLGSRELDQLLNLNKK